jgi:hypothetical protein
MEMTIDERLEKLVGRHEALTQSVGLMALTMNRLENVSAENASSIGVLARAVLSPEERLDRMQGNTAA